MPSSSGYDPQRHGPRRVVGEGFHAQVYAVVRRVPPGCVTTFGDVAGKLGSRNVARHVGFALAALPNHSDVPWFRVVTAQGRLPMRADGEPSNEQRALLEAEGVPFTKRGAIAGFEELRHRFEGDS